MSKNVPKGGKGITKQNPRFANSLKGKSLDKKASKNALISGFMPSLSKKSSQMSMKRKGSAGEESIASTSFMDNVSRIGGNLIRKTHSMISLRNTAQLKGPDLFQRHTRKRTWKAERCNLFTCDNSRDNFPVHIEWRGFSFCISQNRNEGKKAEGQDSIGVAVHKHWEAFVLCDGHDEDGHHVSQAVCSILPHFLLRRVFQGEKKSKMLTEESFVEAFAEAEDAVCWIQEDDLSQGDCVKITKGEYKGDVGYVAMVEEEDSEDEDSEDEEDSFSGDEDESGTRLTVVIDNEKGYDRFSISSRDVVTPRYKGGCTCLCLLRNTKTNKCRVAVLGDSRLMVLGEIGDQFKDEDFIDPVMLTTFIEEEEEDVEGVYQVDCDDKIGYFTPQHNVYNAEERERLKAYQELMNGQYVVNLEQGYLVNPETKMQIQPTRGFGDFEMQSAGYSHTPQVSSEFYLTANTILVGASDGIFESEIWSSDEEFLKFVHDKRKGKNALDISQIIYEETVTRCGDKSRLDDISLFTFIAPKVQKNYRRKHTPRKISTKKSLEENMKRMRSSYRSRGMKLRRATVTRADIPGAHLFRKFFSKREEVVKTIQEQEYMK